MWEIGITVASGKLLLPEPTTLAKELFVIFMVANPKPRYRVFLFESQCSIPPRDSN
jgi:hypothetical protein